MSAPAVSHVADLVDPATPHIVDVVAASHNTRTHANSTTDPIPIHDPHSHDAVTIANGGVENAAKIYHAALGSKLVKTEAMASGPRAQGVQTVQTVITKPTAAQPLAPRVSGERDILNRNVVSSRSSTNVEVYMPMQAMAAEQFQPQVMGETMSKPEMFRNTDGLVVVSPPAPPSTTPSLEVSDEQCSREMQHKRDASKAPRRLKRGRALTKVATATPITRKRRKNIQLLSHVQIGDEVSVYWVDDNRYYDGVIRERMADGKFRVVYLDDDVEVLNLADPKETWRFRGAAAERVKNASRR